MLLLEIPAKSLFSLLTLSINYMGSLSRFNFRGVRHPQMPPQLEAVAVFEDADSSNLDLLRLITLLRQLQCIGYPVVYGIRYLLSGRFYH